MNEMVGSLTGSLVETATTMGHMTESLTWTWVWIVSVIIFIVWYYFIAMEEKYNINKAKPAMFMWTFLFMLIGVYYAINGMDKTPLEHWLSELILEISEIYFFLFVAMTFIETLIDRRVFEVLKYNLISKWWSYKKLFWVVWSIAFFLSPIADNLTTALILSTVVLTIDKDNKNFLIPCAISIVVAANAWWAWSPFWDITTLMVWAAKKWEFIQFVSLFPASIVWWLITWFLLSKFLPEWKPKLEEWAEKPKLKDWAKVIIGIGIGTIIMAVLSHQLFDFPAMWWMLFWLSVLKLYAYFLKRRRYRITFDIFASIKLIENDTLLFFFGILSAVWALHHLGFLHYIAVLYEYIWQTSWNIWVWFISAVVDNVPVMSAVIKADPSMWLDQWLLITLTAWIGWSLISFGSAAWVWVMGKMKWIYTFQSHMKYFRTVLVWYLFSILVRYVQFEFLWLYIH